MAGLDLDGKMRSEAIVFLFNILLFNYPFQLKIRILEKRKTAA